MNEAPRRVLVAQTLYLGDVILTIPFLRKLRSLFPTAEIDVLVREESVPILLHEQSVTETIAYEDTIRRRGIRGTLSLAKRLRLRRYDTALVFPGSVRTSVAIFLARIPRRIGTNQTTGIDLHLHLAKFPKAAWYIPGGTILRFASGLQRLLGAKRPLLAPLFTDVVTLDPSSPALERNFQLLAPLGVRAEKPARYAPLLPGKKDLEACDRLAPAVGNGKTKTVAVAPGSFWRTKRWPPEKFAEVIRSLLAKGINVVLLGGEQDGGVCETISSLLGDARLINVCGKLSIMESAVVLSRCNALLTNDSAAIHIGAAMGVPTAVILGPTIREFGFIPPEPLAVALEVPDLWCRPCTPFGGAVCPTGSFDCMERITAGAALEAIERLLTARINR